MRNMDFGTLLHMAKKNSENVESNCKYYSTKYAPPKKESKEKKLSDNIKKFLQKREQEEQERIREERRKLSNLLAMRDEKSKSKIRKMLKVTKSANKSVLDDAINTEHTSVTIHGPEQPDQDDYGYVSTEANAFYQRYIDKVKDVKEDKGFAPSRPQSVKDLSGTKERVKAAITREIEERSSHTRQRHSETGGTSKEVITNTTRPGHTSAKTLYDPEAERKEEERKKREEQQKKMKSRKPPPPPMDFQALLKLAEKKQYEPVEIQAVVKKAEPERLLTSKEKKEMQERQRAKEARERRDRERKDETIKGRREKQGEGTHSELSGHTPKSSSTNKSNSNSSSMASSSSISNSNALSKKLKSDDSKKDHPSAVSLSLKHTSSNGKYNNGAKGGPHAMGAKCGKTENVKTSSKQYSPSCKADGINGVKSPHGNVSNKPSQKGPTREFPPRDVRPAKGQCREAPLPESEKSRQFPPVDVRRGPPPNRPNDRKAQPSKRRILDDDDDDESEYDSELDDFIDDGDCEEDYSSHIKAIFGYDKSKYRDVDDTDDVAMESNFAQVQREEYISKKIGLQEDLEDMKLEALEKKRKMMKKRRVHE